MPMPFLFMLVLSLWSCDLKKNGGGPPSKTGATLGEHPVEYESSSFDGRKHGLMKTPESVCNATLVSKNTIALALHCLREDPLAYVGFEFFPFEGPSASVVDAYFLDDKKDTVIYALDRSYDTYYELGKLDLKKPIVLVGFDPKKESSFSVRCAAKGLLLRYAAFTHNCDTKPGFSGAAVIQNNTIVGLHFGFDSKNQVNLGIDFGMLFEEEGDIAELAEWVVQERFQISSPHIRSPHVRSPHVRSPHVRAPHVRAPHVRTPDWLKDSIKKLGDEVSHLKIDRDRLKVKVGDVNKALRGLDDTINGRNDHLKKQLKAVEDVAAKIRDKTLELGRAIDQKRLEAQEHVARVTKIDDAIEATRKNLSNLDQDLKKVGHKISDVAEKAAKLSYDNQLTKNYLSALEDSVKIQRDILKKAATELDKAQQNVTRTSAALVDKTIENLKTPEGQALLMVAVTVSTGGAGASMIGAAQTSFAGALANAAVTSVSQQVVASLASGKSPREALKDMSSKDGLKSIGAAVLTAGVLSGYADSGAFLGDMGSASQKASSAVAKAAIRASITTSIHGGKFSEAFARDLATQGIDASGQLAAEEIGSAFDYSEMTLDQTLKYLSHAGAGCAMGLGTAVVSEEDSDNETACLSGAGGAVVGEAIGSYYRETEVAEAQEAVEGFVDGQGEKIRELREQGYSNDEIKELIMSEDETRIYVEELDQLKDRGVNLAKFGAALGAYAAGADAEGIHIAAMTGENAAEHNALAMATAAGAILMAIDVVLTGMDIYDIHEAYQRGDVEEGNRLLAELTGTTVVGAFFPGERLLGKLMTYIKKYVPIEKIANAVGEFVLKRAGKVRKAAKRAGAKTSRGVEAYAKRTKPTAPKGSKPRGAYEPEVGSVEKRRSIMRQNESADSLADKGYDIEIIPEGAGGGIKPGKSPDYKIDGRRFDAYSPATGNKSTIRSTISKKSKEQAERIVLNLDDAPVSTSEMVEYLGSNPVETLDELIIVRGGEVNHYFPF